MSGGDSLEKRSTLSSTCFLSFFLPFSFFSSLHLSLLFKWVRWPSPTERRSSPVLESGFFFLFFFFFRSFFHREHLPKRGLSKCPSLQFLDNCELDKPSEFESGSLSLSLSLCVCVQWVKDCPCGMQCRRIFVTSSLCSAVSSTTDFDNLTTCHPWLTNLCREGLEGLE